MCNKQAVGGKVHFGCKKKWGLDGLMNLFSYKGLIKMGIHRLKYEFLQDMERELEELVESKLIKILRERQNIEWKFFLKKKPIIIGVPLYWRRQNWRGFNQAEMIGKMMGKKLKLEYGEGLVKRIKSTKPQVKLKKNERKKNIKQAFKVNKKVRLGDNILLIDDVWTTGETMREIGRQLKKAGAGEVWGLTLAR